MSNTQVRVEGLEKALRNIDANRILPAPLKRFFTRAGETVANEAKNRAPVDSGRLRSSITHEIDNSDIPLYVAVGSNVHYAPYLEHGTGLLADGEGTGGKGGRHWPPSSALETWARRHGMPSGFVVARAIGRRGGLRPRRYLRGALEDSMSDIKSFARDLGREIAGKGNE